MRWSFGFVLALLACGGDAKDNSQLAAEGAAGEAVAGATHAGQKVRPLRGNGPESGAGGARRADVAWEDPEPPEAQALAEAVVGAPWNADKTTRLSMSITTLVDRTTGLTGFSTGIAGSSVSLDERLDRLHAEVTEHQIVIRLSGSVLFDFDRAEIRADAERTLGEVAEVLKAHAGRPLRIEGHTDSIASDAYNQSLSEKRAAAVRSWLAAHGIEASRMRTSGYGESRPVADNATAAGRQQNRRVEIIVETGSS